MPIGRPTDPGRPRRGRRPIRGRHIPGPAASGQRRAPGTGGPLSGQGNRPRTGIGMTRANGARNCAPLAVKPWSR